MKQHLRISHSQIPAREGWPLLTFCSLDTSFLGRHSLLEAPPSTCETQEQGLLTHSLQPSPAPATPPPPTAEGSKGKGSPGAPPTLPQLREASLFEQIAKSSSFPAQSYGSSPLAGAQHLSGHLAEKMKGNKVSLTCQPATVPLPRVGSLPR